MGIKLVDETPGIYERGKGMRTSQTQGEGLVPALVLECNVVDVNFVNWTVDVFSAFDQRYFPNIQVASPYVHPNRGEGIYAMPEIMAKCLVAIPSDLGSPPYVIGFVMRMEDKQVPEGEETDSSGGMGPSTFAGNRKRGKPGDIVMKGRDGNFVVLHRGGVLQVGSTSLAQRIYIPLRNLITDVSQNYEHFNMGGAINWGISTGETTAEPETEFRQVFRLFANDIMADARIAIGKVHQPIPEPAGSEGEIEDLNNLGIGTDPDNPIVIEVAIAPQAFNAETGAPNISVAQNGTKMKFFFDQKGGGFLRAEGSLLIRIKEKFKLKADKGIEFESDEDVIFRCRMFKVESESGVRMDIGDGNLRMGAGELDAATVGSAVDLTIPAGTIPGVPNPLTLVGFIRTGRSNVKM